MELSGAVRTLAIASRVIERALDDMTLAQFRVLTLISSSPERASRIAEQAAVSKPSLTGLLDGLEAKGWVQRVDVEGDRRGVSLTVTPAGRAAHDAAERAMARLLDDVLESAGPKGRRSVVEGLEALSAALRDRAGVKQ